MKDVNISCGCGNHLSATVFKHIPFDLTCIKCKANYVEGDDKVFIIKDNLISLLED